MAGSGKAGQAQAESRQIRQRTRAERGKKDKRACDGALTSHICGPGLPWLPTLHARTQSSEGYQVQAKRFREHAQMQIARHAQQEVARRREATWLASCNRRRDTQREPHATKRRKGEDMLATRGANKAKSNAPAVLDPSPVLLAHVFERFRHRIPACART